MRTLVTGGAGFIGSNLVDGLLAAGHEVAIFDDFSSGKEANLAEATAAGATVHRGSILDAGALAEAFAAVGPDAVFHLAAQIDVRRSVADPLADALLNVGGTINVASAALHAGVARLVNTSTGGAIYGEAELIPTPETVEPLPEAPYGQSKFCAERYLGLFARLHGLSSVTLRLGNVYGPRQDPLGEAGVVAIFCGRLERGERPVVFGTGEQTRDYVYVGDVVAAQLAALEHSGAVGELNIGTGVESSVLDIIRALAPNAHADFTPELQPARQGEMERSCLDVTKAAEQLGWSPTVDLAEGLRRTVEWAQAAAA